MCKEGTKEEKLGTRGTSLGYSHNRVTMHNPYEIATITIETFYVLTHLLPIYVGTHNYGDL